MLIHSLIVDGIEMSKFEPADKNPRWNNGRILNSNGYVLIRVGKGHPCAIGREGYAYEHTVVWCAAGRERPGPGEELHHINECQSDNRIENLELAEGGKHQRAHRQAEVDGIIEFEKELEADGYLH